MDRRVATLTGDPDLEPVIAAGLGQCPGVELIMRCVDRVELLALVRSRSVDGVVSAGHPPWLDVETLEEMKAASIRVIGVSGHPFDVEGFLGLKVENMPPSIAPPDLIEKLFASAVALEPVPSEVPQGRLIAVWGPKGSPGRTTVAVELATCLAATERRTFLMDADPYGGDILQRLGIIEDVPTVIWAARLAGKGQWNEALIAQNLRRAGPRGPVVLPGISRAELWAEVSDFGFERLLESARQGFRFIVADVGFCLESNPMAHLDAAGRNRMARSTVVAADRVVAVLGAGAVALKAFVASWPELTSLTDPDRVIIAANRVPPSSRKELSEALRSAIGKPVASTLPDVWTDAQHALSRSRSVSEARPRSSLVDGIRTLASSLGGQVERKGLLIRLGGRS